MDDHLTLARTLYGEAKAYSVADAVAIGHTVMNRVAYPNWPVTVSEVCQQPWQYSCWNTGDPNRQRISRAAPGVTKWFDVCYETAAEILGGSPDPTYKATHYYAKSMKKPPYWVKGKTPCYETPGHYFFNDIDTKPPVTAVEALAAERPLSSTRTVKGGQVAGAAGIATAAAGVASEMAPALPVLNWVRDNLSVALIVLGVAVVGAVGYMVWARIDDRMKGHR